MLHVHQMAIFLLEQYAHHPQAAVIWTPFVQGQVPLARLTHGNPMERFAMMAISVTKSIHVLEEYVLVQDSADVVMASYKIQRANNVTLVRSMDSMDIVVEALVCCYHPAQCVEIKRDHVILPNIAME